MANELLKTLALQCGFEGREEELASQLFDIVEGHAGKRYDEQAPMQAAALAGHPQQQANASQSAAGAALGQANNKGKPDPA